MAINLVVYLVFVAGILLGVFLFVVVVVVFFFFFFFFFRAFCLGDALVIFALRPCDLLVEVVGGVGVLVLRWDHRHDSPSVARLIKSLSLFKHKCVK